MKKTITQEEKNMFYFLNDLRDSGVTNMFGAGSYLMVEFNVNKNVASTALSKWMKMFSADGYEHLMVVRS